MSGALRLVASMILVVGLVGCTSEEAAAPPPAADCSPRSTARPEIPTAGPASAPPDIAGVLPAERAVRWNPGLNAVGGIPHRSTVFQTVQPSGDDDTAAIQAALDQAPADQVVQLAAGTFRISGEGLKMIRSDVTLRGAGPAQTRLVKEPGSNESLITMGTKWFRYTQPVDLAADPAQGSNTVTLTSDPGLQPGEIVVVDQLTDPASTVWSERSPQGDPSRGWFGRYNRPIGQVLEVSSMGGNVVTFSTGLHIDFRTEHSAQLVRFAEVENGPVTPAVRSAGIEDLYVCGGEGGDGGGNIHLFGTAYSWVRNVESAGSLGGSVVLDGTFRSVLRDSYLHSTREPNPGGGGYGIVLNAYAADNLVENNISWNFNKVIAMRTTGGGNVIGYNYMEDGWGQGYPMLPEVGLNASHMTTPHHELFEGNQSWNFGGDSVWGNSIYITAFRNHLTGQRRSLPPLQLRDESRHFVGLQTAHRWYSFLGNVLGTADQTPDPGETFEYERSPESGDPGSAVPVWLLGYDGTDPGKPLDPTVAQTAIRHGNFDYPTQHTDQQDGLPETLPHSLYLTAKPAFFGDHPWPWVTPEQPSNAVGTLPAWERMDQS
ncbi:glycoside hydrolase family 55 protein [Pseudonocardia nigra]|uniref:glycoside hydrolase family 55 protein n=1 Tax=Pseudonocardia nigra TaxID=1921578 RepID=UPI001C5F36F8|nr:glycoside hydrolase family 55 protein [Pseudonocardia nigra]